MMSRARQIELMISEALGIDADPAPQENGLEKELDSGGHEIGPKTVNRDEVGASVLSSRYNVRASKKKKDIPPTSGPNGGPAADA